MNPPTPTPGPESKGASPVQELIRRIHEDGVRGGKEEADRLVREAKEEAARILREAQKAADELRRGAAVEIERHREAAHAALKQSARDTVLELQTRVAGHFESFVRRFVTEATTDPAFLRRFILALAGGVARDLVGDGEAEVRLPEALLSPDTEEGRGFLSALSSDMLREGVELSADASLGGGARVVLTGQHLEIDLSDEFIAGLISERLQPRFRALLEGLE